MKRRLVSSLVAATLVAALAGCKTEAPRSSAPQAAVPAASAPAPAAPAPAAEAPAGMPAGHPSPQSPSVHIAGVEKAPGGSTLQEIFLAKADLAGKEVLFRGKVVKYNTGIMGKNWLHVQDGTGEGGANDLTVTTNAEARVGDTVLVRGRLATDKDFGFGYKYGVIVEDAEVTVE